MTDKQKARESMALVARRIVERTREHISSIRTALIEMHNLFGELCSLVCAGLDKSRVMRDLITNHREWLTLSGECILNNYVAAKSVEEIQTAQYSSYAPADEKKRLDIAGRYLEKMSEISAVLARLDLNDVKATADVATLAAAKQENKKKKPARPKPKYWLYPKGVSVDGMAMYDHNYRPYEKGDETIPQLAHVLLREAFAEVFGTTNTNCYLAPMPANMPAPAELVAELAGAKDRFSTGWFVFATFGQEADVLYHAADLKTVGEAEWKDYLEYYERLKDSFSDVVNPAVVLRDLMPPAWGEKWSHFGTAFFKLPDESTPLDIVLISVIDRRELRYAYRVNALYAAEAADDFGDAI